MPKDAADIATSGMKLFAHKHKDGSIHVIAEMIIDDERIANAVIDRLSHIYDYIPGTTVLTHDEKVFTGEEANRIDKSISLQDAINGLLNKPDKPDKFN